jgi:hypothetical protein
LRVSLADLNSASAPSDREARLRNVIEQARQIGDLHGSYWRNRAEAMLTESTATPLSYGSSSASVELTKVEVRQLLAAGEERAAIEKLIQSRDLEAQAGRGATALQFADQAHALLSRRSSWLAAADAAAETARQFHNQDGAAASHARAIYALAQALKAQSKASATGENIADRYESALNKQLELWPDAEETSAVEPWLVAGKLAARTKSPSRLRRPAKIAACKLPRRGCRAASSCQMADSAAERPQGPMALI